MNRKEYLMQLLCEEAAEIIQATNKCLRFTDNHAYYKDTNFERLQVEMTDFFTVVKMLENEMGISFNKEPSAKKEEKVLYYMDISRQMGTLND